MINEFEYIENDLFIGCWEIIDKFIDSKGINTPYYLLGLLKFDKFWNKIYDSYRTEYPTVCLDNIKTIEVDGHQYIPWTLVQCLCYMGGDVQMLETLISRGADPLIEDARGYNCFQIFKENEDRHYGEDYFDEFLRIIINYYTIKHIGYSLHYKVQKCDLNFIFK